MLSPLRGLVVFGLLAAALVGLGGSSANASHTPDGQPADRDFVTGYSIITTPGPPTPPQPTFVWVFDASSGPSGQNPTGTVRLALNSPEGRPLATYNVTCLSVAGNHASIGVVLSEPGIAPVPTNAVFDVEDGVGDAPDAWTLGAVSSPPTTCPDPPSSVPAFPGVITDLTVHDAVELPSDPRQCFGGGWQSYGFETLGKCLEFVFKARLCELLKERLGHSPKFCPPMPPRPVP
jgi:hypothetical protein